MRRRKVTDRHKQWIFTLNLQTADPNNLEGKRLIEKVRSHLRTAQQGNSLTAYLSLQQLKPITRGLKFQREIAPLTGQIHLQGFIWLINARSLAALKVASGTNRISLKVSDFPNQAWKYVEKDRTRDETEAEFCHESGEEPARGKRTDLKKAAEHIDNSETLVTENSMLDHPDFQPVCAKYSKWVSAKLTKRAKYFRYTRMPHGIILYGPTYTGKTYWANELAWELFDYAPFTAHISKPLEWFDHYGGNNVVLFDEFANTHSVNALKRLCDSYVTDVPIKGAHTPYHPRVVIIATNIKPDAGQTIYEALFPAATDADLRAVARRFPTTVDTQHVGWQRNLRPFPRVDDIIVLR